MNAQATTTTRQHSYRLTYIWIGLLCVGIVIQAGLASYVVITSHRQQATDIRLAKNNADTLAEQQQTIRVLCDRGYLAGDVLLATADFIKMQQPLPPGSASYLRQLNLAYNQITDELTRAGSPCVA